MDTELPLSRVPGCTACPLHLGCKSVGIPTVEVEGSPGSGDACLVIWGRNPGPSEDIEGMPFVGDSGHRLWDHFLRRICHWDRCRRTYLLNCVRCWTPGNVAPSRTHIAKCYPHTARDLSHIWEQSPPPARMAWLTLGKEAAISACKHALGEAAPESVEEALRRNARTVKWKQPDADTWTETATAINSGASRKAPSSLSGRTSLVATARASATAPAPPASPASSRDVFLVHTYHPAATLRNENYLPHVYDHLDLLIRWLDGTPVASAEPTVVRPFHPSKWKP